MKEKTADIDILEEKEKKAIEYLKLVAKERTLIPLCDDIKILLNLVETLIAENKELKEKIKEINEEYNAEQKHEMENTIPKSKAKEEINGKFKEAKGLYERGVQPQAQYTMKLLRDLEQSLLGKE